MKENDIYAVACLSALMRKGLPLPTIARKANVSVGYLRGLMKESDVGRCNSHLTDLRREYEAMPAPSGAQVRFLD